MTYHPPNDVARTVKGKKRCLATCKCGHEGLSQFPEFYQCSLCYHEANAKSALEKAEHLEQRAARFRAESVLHTKKADYYREKFKRA